MSKTETTKTAKAVAEARATITARPNDDQRQTLILVRPTTAKAIADGWTLALQNRNGMTLLGETQLAAFLTKYEERGEKAEKESSKAVADELRKIASKVRDLPHLLAAGWEVCASVGFRPCRLLALCGPGAKEKCAEIDAAREKMNGLRTELKAAQKAFIEATIEGKKTDKLRKRMTDAASKVMAYTPDFEKIAEGYKITARKAVAVIANMTDLRAAADNA